MSKTTHLRAVPAHQPATVTVTVDRDDLWRILLAAQAYRPYTEPAAAERLRQACERLAAQAREVA